MSSKLEKAIIWSIRHKEDNSYGIEILFYSENSVFDATHRAFPIPSVARSLHFLMYTRET